MKKHLEIKYLSNGRIKIEHQTYKGKEFCYPFSDFRAEDGFVLQSATKPAITLGFHLWVRGSNQDSDKVVIDVRQYLITNIRVAAVYGGDRNAAEDPERIKSLLEEWICKLKKAVDEYNSYVNTPIAKRIRKFSSPEQFNPRGWNLLMDYIALGSADVASDLRGEKFLQNIALLNNRISSKLSSGVPK